MQQLDKQNNIKKEVLISYKKCTQVNFIDTSQFYTFIAINCSGFEGEID
jgi:hypothetical protein